jgi:hypothetical protein
MSSCPELCPFQKLDDDKVGGEAVRNASMTTLHKRRRSDSTDVSDSENVDPKQPSRKLVRRRTNLVALQSDIGDMKEIIAISVKDQQINHKEMVDVLRASNAAYIKSQETFAEIFRGKF